MKVLLVVLIVLVVIGIIVLVRRNGATRLQSQLEDARADAQRWY
jgi:Tfp pilus assembly protein PilX